MTQNKYYIFSASTKGDIDSKLVLDYDEYLKNEYHHVGIERINPSQWGLNNEGTMERIYRITILDREIQVEEIKKLKEESDKRGFILKVFKLEELV